MSRMYAIDVEVFRNYFVAVAIDVADFIKIANENKGKSISQLRIALNAVNKLVFKIGLNTNDIAKLVTTINSPDVILVSFNGLDYDNVLLNACISKVSYWRTIQQTTKALYDLSKRIISNSRGNIYNDEAVNVYKNVRTSYRTIDVQKVFGLNKIKKSLKQTLINLKWYSIKDYEMPPVTAIDRWLYAGMHPDTIDMLEQWDRYIVPEYEDDMIAYCTNDVLGVCYIVYVKQADISLRFKTSIKYGVNALSSSESNMADRLFAKFYCDRSGITPEEYAKGRTYNNVILLRDCIAKNIKFQTPELKQLLEFLKLKKLSDTRNELDLDVKFGNISYKIKTGGLHSEDKPAIFKAEEDSLLIDADVTSYYPNIVRHNRIAPAHLNPDIFVETTSIIVDERILAKQKGDKVTADVLKIVINSGIFGKMGFENSPAYDTKAMISVTIQGQLYLLMLIELLTLEGFQVISANTDGVVSIVPKNRENEYHAVCDKWSTLTGFNLEYTMYDKYIRRDVNNYMALKTGDGPVNKRLKQKGSFNPKLYEEDLRKGFNKPIVAIAVNNYYLYDTPIMDTITSSKDIYDFCVALKASDKFVLELNTIKGTEVAITKLSKNIRYYVSKGYKEEGLLMKNDVTLAEGAGRKRINVVSGRTITIFNEFFEHDSFEDYNVDYGYYYTETKKIINAIEAGSTDKRVIRNNVGQYKLGL